MREPPCYRKEVSCRFRFPQVQKMRGTQERLVARQHRFGERSPFVQTRYDKLFKLTQRRIGHRFLRRKIGEAPKQASRGFVRLSRNRRHSELIKQHAVRRRRPSGRGKRSFYFEPLNGDARLPTLGKRRIAIRGWSALHVTRERHG